ncbi:DUF2479 domain-containing protein [Lacrimispora amygdalina]|uniref:DUF2479 domain-containing protein n=1 Tax=Lacrimispora amygdalina TaxID=253257 RepID=A0A3E2NCP8_9FIRM|nr:BppU family phage baseplate upper protein [Clostridium indicum]RFZ78797.1 DUF2479 domain-containing protein [Clostridium indicum]
MNYDIELNANDSSVLETQYAFTQGDYGQIQFSIRVKADGAYVTNAQRAYIVFTLPNGYVVTGADMTKSVATYTYPFQGSELQVPGTIVADVKLVYTDGQMSSNKFSFICRYDPLHDKSFNAGPYISQLQQIVDDGQIKINYLQSLIEILQGEVGETGLTKNDLQSTRDPVAVGLKAIDAYLAQYMLIKGDLVNNALTTIAGVAPLDAAMGKTLQDQITTTNSNLTGLSSTVDSLSTDITSGIKPVTNRTANFVTDGTDYDTLSQPGWYYIYSTVHAPASNLGRVLVRVESIYVSGVWYTTQKAIELYSVGAIQPKVYERWVTNINDTFSWTSWIQTV